MHEVQDVQKEEDVVEAEAEARGEKEDDGGGQSRVLHFLVCSLAHPVLGRSFCMNFMNELYLNLNSIKRIKRVNPK